VVGLMRHRLSYFYNVWLQDFWYDRIRSILVCPKVITVTFKYGDQFYDCNRHRFHRGECES